MFATRKPWPALFLSGTLAVFLGPASAGFAQETKTTAPAAKSKAKVEEKAKEEGPVDLNSATAEDLATLPGIGEANARKIINARPHKAIADLAEAGIPAATVDKLRPLVVVKPLPAPLDINGADSEKLQTLPGVGPALAKAIIEARPFASYDDLEKVKGLGPKKVDEFRGRLKFTKEEPVAKKAEPKKAEPEPSAEKTAKKAEPAREKMAKKETAKGKEAKAAAEKPKLAPGTKVNLNTASKDELDLLPGIGEFYAQKIIDARPFSKIEDIMKIKGIKEVEFNKVKDVITVK